jgi:predicted mannosyl-3-phosphoglycerate phosphatase (HAD superfamily)
MVGYIMMWNLEKLEKERADLIEVISGLKNWQRFAIDDRNIIALQIAAHMMRLSDLDEELQKLHMHMEAQQFHA